MIVADATVVVVALVSASGAGARARERLRLDPDLHVPHLLDVEVTSALRRRVRSSETALVTAERALSDLAQLPALRWGHGPLLSRVWELRENVTSYDATYVALAKALGAVLVTSDGPLSRAPGLRCPVEVLID